MENTQTSGWSGTDDKTKGKPDKVKGKQDKGKGKGKPSKGKCKSKRKRKGKPVKNTKSGRTRVGITLTTGLTQTGGRATGVQICGMILRGSKLQDSCHRRSRFKNNPTQRMEEVDRWFDHV